MKKLNIYQINAFTSDVFGGNPAVVIKSDDLTDSDMQKIAAEMNVSETAFLSKSNTADYKLRWMTPVVEVDLCGHATIASLHYLKETGALPDNSAVRFETRSGIIKCCDEKEFYYMQIPDFHIRKYNGNKYELLICLNLQLSDIQGDFFLLENGYIYIQVKDLKTLANIKPDFQKLLICSETTSIKSFVIYTLETFEKESTAHLRFYDPSEGINEDPVTGSANGPLAKVLIWTGFLKDEDAELQFEQGDFIGRPGRVKVIYRNEKTFIGGKAVTFLKGEINF